MTSEQAGMRLFHLFRKAPGQTQMLDILEMGLGKVAEEGRFRQSRAVPRQTGLDHAEGLQPDAHQRGCAKGDGRPLGWSARFGASRFARP